MMLEESSTERRYSKIPKLTQKDQWIEWVQDIKSWCVQKDYDLPPPAAVPPIAPRATVPAQVAHTELVTIYNTEFAAWRRKQYKAVDGIRSKCGTRALKAIENPVLYDYDRTAALAKLEQEFKPNDQATFAEVNSHLHEMNLSDYENMTEYIEAFAADIAKLELVGQPMASAFSIPLFCNGLGVVYSQWQTSFDQLHPLFGPNPATLEQAFDSASIEAQRIGRQERAKALIAKQIALLAPTVRKRPASSQGGRRTRCEHCKDTPGADRRHTSDKCWTKFPHLRTEWEAQHPERAAGRKARFETKGKPGHFARMAAAEEPRIPIEDRPMAPLPARAAGRAQF